VKVKAGNKGPGGGEKEVGQFSLGIEVTSRKVEDNSHFSGGTSREM